MQYLSFFWREGYTFFDISCFFYFYFIQILLFLFSNHISYFSFIPWHDFHLIFGRSLGGGHSFIFTLFLRNKSKTSLVIIIILFYILLFLVIFFLLFWMLSWSFFILLCVVVVFFIWLTFPAFFLLSNREWLLDWPKPLDLSKCQLMQKNHVLTTKGHPHSIGHHFALYVAQLHCFLGVFFLLCFALLFLCLCLSDFLAIFHSRHVCDFSISFIRYLSFAIYLSIYLSIYLWMFPSINLSLILSLWTNLAGAVEYTDCFSATNGCPR